jgi:hypothetical protein
MRCIKARLSRRHAVTRSDSEWRRRRRALAEVLDPGKFLLHIERLAHDEIERMTGIKQSALKMRVKRASDMPERLAERYDDDGQRSDVATSDRELR